MHTATDVLRRSRNALVAVGFLFVVGAASAEVVGVHLEVTGVDQMSHTDTIDIWTVQDPDGTYVYSSSDTMTLMDPSDASNTVIGQLTPDLDAIWAGNSNLNPADKALHNSVTSFTYIEDPTINLNFSVQAGPLGSFFSISSALVTFPSITGATATASASYSVTDITGDGATLTGATTAGGAYEAAYNGYVGSGTTFASYFGTPIVASAFGTANPSANSTPTGIGTAVDMSATNDFSLTAFDLASGTTTYTIVPEPASIGLLVLGLALIRRR